MKNRKGNIRKENNPDKKEKSNKKGVKEKAKVRKEVKRRSLQSSQGKTSRRIGWNQ